ncbi:TetR/AcrR family transcriptional regulator [Glycomyces niveus]|uniref:TetR/AcrR family transcriptional regulator n=1 Tax=Glycomyces niveus TaxID=2820287 RepID=A0ABS3U240_9ACTN|nr:TetR/AcrR family transcriptional regulator [Glycomyces sp. NEAU-S30]MBO3732839.1 TetR/AcrR family transcriptional regulator [Glycomyces sp. NEAU-S30]
MERKATSRRRGEALEQAILDAVWDEFREVGFSKLTMEGVAKRAGTSKPVLYRRWSSPVELMIACAASRVPKAESVPDTGTLRGDTIALLTLAHERMRIVGQTAMLSMLAQVSVDPEARKVLIEGIVNNLSKALSGTVYARAIARGELAEEHLTERLARLPIDLMRNEFILFGHVDAGAIEEMLDQVILPALRARGATV